MAAKFVVMKLATFISIILMAFSGSVATAYVQVHNPGMLKELLIQIDVFGVSSASIEEKRRRNTITFLPVPFEQREALKNRTVFLGATKEMVILAIGEPKTVSKPRSADKAEDKESWVYYFGDDARPTLLNFANNKLISTEKGSAIDIDLANQNNLQILHTQAKN